jgi:DNA polymerase
VVVTLGNFAAKLLLRTDTGITRLRGRTYEWWGRFLVPTFHPAAALRGSTDVLEAMRADFGLVRDVVDGNLVVETPAASEPHPTPAAEDAEQLGLFGGSA